MTLPIRSDNYLKVWETLALRISQLAESSQRNYLQILREYCDFLGCTSGTREAAIALVEAQERTILGYSSYIKAQPGVTPRELLSRSKPAGQLISEAELKPEFTISSATYAKKLIIIRSLYNVLFKAGLIKSNPCQFLRLPKRNAEKRQPTNPFPRHKVKELFMCCSERTEKGIQDRAMLACLFGGALRISEVAALRLIDMKQSESGIVYLRLSKTKSQVEQNQPLAEWAAKLMQTWIEIRVSKGATPEDFVFCGALLAGRHKPGIYPKTITLRLKRLAEKIGLDPTLFSGHSPRHTAITDLFNKQVGPAEIQLFARHSSIETTVSYNHSRKEIEEHAGLTLEF